MARPQALTSFLAVLSSLIFSVLLAFITGCAGGGGQSTTNGRGDGGGGGQQEKVTISFTAQPENIFAGQSASLSWTTTNATSVRIDGLGSFGANGSANVTPTTTQTYTATATGAAGSATAQATVTVGSTASPMQHLIVVIMQNNSFDHLFGKFPAPAGQTVDGLQAGVPGFNQVDASGKTISPFLLTDTSPAALPEGRKEYVADLDGGKMDKFAFTEGDQAMGYYDATIPGIQPLWDFATQYALSDRYFHSVLAEAPTNQLYMVAAQDDGKQFEWQPFYGPCNSPDVNSQALTFTNVGDQLTAKKLDWAVYQEDYGVCGTQFNPMHDPFQYFTSTQNSSHLQDYTQLATALTNGTLPAVSFIIPAHAHDMHPGGAPIGQATDFLSALVQQVQSSNAWSNTVILVTWDTGGGWYDHVAPAALDDQGPGFRVPLIAISPFAKKGYVSHVVADHVSILKLIQWNWGLQSLGARNDASGDLRDLLNF